MAYYSMKKCSRCGYTIKPWGNENVNLRFGNPIIQCEKCKAILIEKNIKEYVMFNNFDYIRYFAPKILRNLILSLPLVLLFTVVINNNNNSTLLFIFFILFIIFLLGSIKKFEKERIDSIKRTKDFDYLNQLYKLGLISYQKYNNFIELYNIKRKEYEIKKFNINDVVSGIFELSLNEINYIDLILKKENIEYNHSEFLLSTIAFYSSIWGAYINEKIGNEKFISFENKLNNAFVEYNSQKLSGNEKEIEKFNELFSIAQSEAKESVLDDGDFVDKGFTEKYLKCFIKEDDIIKVKITVITRIMSKWITPAREMLNKGLID